MTRVLDFLKKPRNIYFSMIFMVTLVAGLVSISFSYYIDESSTDGLFNFTKVDNKIQSDDLVDGVITLAPHESKTIKVYIMSNNTFTSKYKLYYITDKNALVSSTEELGEVIESKEVKEYDLMFSNFEETEAVITLGIENADINTDIVVDGQEIEIIE